MNSNYESSSSRDKIPPKDFRTKGYSSKGKKKRLHSSASSIKLALREEEEVGSNRSRIQNFPTCVSYVRSRKCSMRRGVRVITKRFRTRVTAASSRLMHHNHRGTRNKEPSANLQNTGPSMMDGLSVHLFLPAFVKRKLFKGGGRARREPRGGRAAGEKGGMSGTRPPRKQPAPLPSGVIG